MAEHQKFRNAPITEALIDIQVTLPPEIELGTLLEMEGEIKNKFPRTEEHQTGRLITTGASGEPLTGNIAIEKDGYRFISENDKKVILARLEGFTFSKLKPYYTWKEFRQEAESLWSLYLEIAKPINIKRLAVKYTNRIELPTPIDYTEYFRTTPEIANTLPQELIQYFMQLVMPYRNKDVIAVVTQTIDYSTPVQGILPFIFDIDVFKVVELNPNSDEVWGILDNLRNIKNEIFFESITEKTRGLFE
jgi:uncharacterized protein (TIGR04255 family)